jgi:hypothetical protein
MILQLKILKRQYKRFFESQFRKIQEINKKYAKPRLVMNKSTAISLLFLRFYLLFLVGLLVFKFIMTLRGK